jgi:glucose-6-phosphate 1-dehydrogenase
MAAYPVTDHPVEPAIFVIFGITGDLAQRFLLPALYHLIKDDYIDDHTAIVGVSRSSMSTEDLLSKVKFCITERDGKCDPEILKKFAERLQTIQIDPMEPDDYDRLRDTLQGIEEKHGVCMNRIFYLAIPSQVYRPIIEKFGEHGLNIGCGHKRATSRLLVEKPFGYDLVSANDLIEHTAQYFTEEQTFRVDHYLAKETVQNILFFRTHNPMFAGVWNREHVVSIDIQAREKLGVEGRGSFYDNIGALRDIIQNHLMQVMSLVTMEPIESVTSSTLHAAKEDLFRAIRTVDPRDDRVIRAQYKGYAKEVGNPGSQTETFASVQLHIDNERWRGVPITLTTGKALNAKYTGITVVFRDKEHHETVNELIFRIQPNEGIHVNLVVKRPGFHNVAEAAPMDFSYEKSFGNVPHPAAYERVLLDAVRGSHSLFATNTEVLEAWRVMQPILDTWTSSQTSIAYYERGSNGPAEA